ncbi:specifically androgen-regulated gene protein [Rhea pennata]|uniref:specifically androgen-regulated gene protein n=1 Tax=Rhea pennata TaxID=8795 RepID=UPI002E252478
MATAAGDMPKKGPWLGMARCNSGSCDSMASTTSNRSERSDNSYDYLSVEEKECLMFLEETIGSLDAEADSGVSTDETDGVESAPAPGTRPGRGSAPRDLENGAPAPSPAQQRAAEQKSDRKASARSSPAPAAVPGPGYCSLPRTAAAASRPGAHGASDGKATARAAGAPAPAHGPSRGTAEEQRLDGAGAAAVAEPPGSAVLRPLEALRDGAGARGGLAPSGAAGAGGQRAEPESPERESAAAARGRPEPPACGEPPAGRRGPPTAPKPRKLPPNIVLKSSRNPAISPPAAGAGCAAADRASAGRPDAWEREKARREALEKLGLPRDAPRAAPRAAAPPRAQAVPGAAGALGAAGSPGERRVAPGARHPGFKSNTLERSGVGLGSGVAGKDRGAKSSGSLGKMSFMERMAPSFLRGGRPRPASLGAGQDSAGFPQPQPVQVVTTDY